MNFLWMVPIISALSWTFVQEPLIPVPVHIAQPAAEKPSEAAQKEEELVTFQLTPVSSRSASPTSSTPSPRIVSAYETARIALVSGNISSETDVKSAESEAGLIPSAVQHTDLQVLQRQIETYRRLKR